MEVIKIEKKSLKNEIPEQFFLYTYLFVLITISKHAKWRKVRKKS